MECICNSGVILPIYPFYGPLREYDLRERASDCFVVSPAKQKRDICIAFPASSLSSAAAAA